jgi:hypothetical protein
LRLHYHRRISKATMNGITVYDIIWNIMEWFMSHGFSLCRDW